MNLRRHSILFIVLILFLSRELFAVPTTIVRSELSRYTLLRDRTMVDRDLEFRPHYSFLSVNAVLSSGLKRLIGDVSNGTKDTQTGTDEEKTLNILAVLNRYINSEYFVDADLEAGIPVPNFKFSGVEYDTSIFYNLNFGLSLSLSNFGDVTNPRAQTYIKKDTKVGIAGKASSNKKEHFTFAFYQLTRSDLGAIVTASGIAQDESLFEFGDLNKTKVTYSADIGYHRRGKKYDWLAEVKELQLWTVSTQKRPLYGTRPMFHARYGRHYKSSSGPLWNPFIGIHYRKKYALGDGIYLGIILKGRGRIPLVLVAKASNQFLHLAPIIETKYFRFKYSYKTPYRNPQDDMWVPAQHNIAFNFPMP
jgi:hypothetical protein